MSKTSIKERNKAIRLAWEREQLLVAEGKGTRDWSQDQQKDILDPDKGKAYDEYGRAFEGQHMKSAAEYPDYQGDPDNIQFLSRDEHLEAHKGSWQNPTNWYYNPGTKEFVDFGDNKPIPCTVISLSEPIYSPSIKRQNISDKLKETDKEKTAPTERTKPSRQEDVSRHSEDKSKNQIKVDSPKVHKSLGDKVLHAVNAVIEFSEKHPVLTGIVKWSGAALATIVTTAIANNNSGGGRSSGDGRSDYSFSDSLYDYSDQTASDDYGDSSDSIDYPDERSSPREHNVSGYDRRQNGKIVHVNPYKRGGKANDD